MIALVGYTGFVGSNIVDKGNIDYRYNSKNIREAYGLHPDLLIYAGLRAEKYLANQNPQSDMERILEAQKNIEAIAPKKLVLISTVDVYGNSNGVDENSQIIIENLQPYGANRYVLECWVREHYPDALIIRLPGLFGKNIKKNFIYDYIHYIPFMLKKEKMEELVQKEPKLMEAYEIQGDGFYRCKLPTLMEEQKLRELFKKAGFSALNFTDSRSVYQFYPLSRLWEDIKTALKNDILLWNPATEPVSAAEVYKFITGKIFCNELMGQNVYYDCRTIHASIFGGEGKYIMNKERILCEIRDFVRRYQE